MIRIICHNIAVSKGEWRGTPKSGTLGTVLARSQQSAIQDPLQACERVFSTDKKY